MNRSIWILLAACGHPAAPDVRNTAGSGSAIAAPIDAALPASAWAVRCRDALTSGRAAAAAIEPKLATMPVEIETRAEREEVHAGAYPPVWKVAPLHVFAVRSAAPSHAQPTWQTFAHFELGGDHRMATRAAGGIDVAISLDGWNPQQADQVIAALEGALEPCFSP